MDFYVLRDGNPVGPYTQDALLEMLSAEQVSAADFVWREGMSDWSPLSTTILPSPTAPPLSPARPWWREYLEPLSLSLSASALVSAAAVAASAAYFLTNTKPSAEATDINTWAVGGGKAYATFYALRITEPPTFVLSRTGGSVELPIDSAPELGRILNELNSSTAPYFESRRLGKYKISRHFVSSENTTFPQHKNSPTADRAVIRLSPNDFPDAPPDMDGLEDVDIKKLTGLLSRVPELEQTFLRRQSALALWSARIPYIWAVSLSCGFLIALAVPWFIRAFSSRQKLMSQLLPFDYGFNRLIYAASVLACWIVALLLTKLPDFLYGVLFPLGILCVGSFFMFATAMRLLNIGRSPFWTLLLLVPVIQFGLFLYCLVMPHRRR